MSIVKMKKLYVIAMADQREALLEGLLRLGCVEISGPDDKLADPAWATLLERDQSDLLTVRNDSNVVNSALSAVEHYAQLKKGMFIQRRPVSEQEFLSDETKVRAETLSREVAVLVQKLRRLEAEETRMLTQQAALMPWQTLDVPLEIKQTEFVAYFLGVMPANTDLKAVQAAMEEAELAADLMEVSADKQQKYVFLTCHKSDEEKTLDLLRPYDFSATAFADHVGSAAENLVQISERLTVNREKQAAISEQIAGYAGERDMLRLGADRMTTETACQGAVEKLLTDGTVVFFEGWAPVGRMNDVQMLLESMDCAWDARDPVPEEYPEVPVTLKNNWLTRPLNMVTEMYSLPAYDNVDPNPLMAPFFILFYGIMMADMGYGLLMVLAGLIIGKKFRPKGMSGNLFNLMTLCGVTTFVMGALTGGFFGDFLTQLVLLTSGKEFALPALFTPLGDVLMILIGSMCLGFVHIITGMTVSVIRKFKRGEIMDAIWNEITWWIVFAGIALMVLKITNIVLYVGIALVLAGPIITGKGLGKITGVFASLYNNITGYFGDILSYSRLMALMLAGSVIAQVFNTLAAIPGNIVIFFLISLIGNVLNFGLNLLGCYVHDLRLQCLEYFGKFYEDGGRPFKPLAMETKYVDIQ